MESKELTEELSKNFIEYAAAVNEDRAIPDATSGLKPVARRILWDGYVNKYASDKEYIKCAKWVGSVIGSTHPHGDSSVYDALARLSQPWVMRYPLIDFHGNQGSQMGDGPAAYRYTNARLSKISEDGLVCNLDKKVVDFMPTYDENDEEPVTLPAIFPNLLCNPNKGIGVSLASNFASHRLEEVAQAIEDYMDGKEPMLPGPDFPTGGVVINKDDIPEIMRTGKGSVKLRGKYKIEKNKIVFYEIPYGVSGEELLNEVGALADEKKLDGIEAVRDETDSKGLRIVIECEKGAKLEYVVTQLFAKTDFQINFSYNQVALVNKVPTELSLKDCIEVYVNHNKKCIVREKEFDKRKAQERQEIVAGLLKALEDIDNIIALIKSADSSVAAKQKLIDKYKFTENQAKAIVNMRLGSLAGLERIELQNENAALNKTIDECNALLSSEKKQEQEIRVRLRALVKKYASPRRTELIQLDETPPPPRAENVIVTIDSDNKIKKNLTEAYPIQHKGGKGTKAKENAAIVHSLSTNTMDTLMLFTDIGRKYNLSVNKIPDVNTNIEEVIKLSTAAEKVISITSLYHKTDAKYAIFFTKKGYIKKTDLDEYSGGRSSQAIKLEENDSIANVTFLNEEDVLLLSRKGMAIRLKTTDISAIGKVTRGVKGMKLVDGDEVIIGLPIHKETDYLALVTKSGGGIKYSLSSHFQASSNRNCMGIRCSDEEIAGAAFVDDDDTLLLISEDNKNIRIPANEITERKTLRAKPLILFKDATIAAVVKI